MPAERGGLSWTFDRNLAIPAGFTTLKELRANSEPPARYENLPLLTSVTLPLVVICASILLASGVVVQFFMPRIQWGALASRLGAFVFGGAATLLAVGEFYLRGSLAGQEPSVIPPSSLVVVLVAALLCGLFVSTKSWSRAGVVAAKQPVLWGLLFTTLGLSGWSYFQLKRASRPSLLISFDRMALGKLHEVLDVHGETDLGQRVELLRFDDQDAEFGESLRVAPPIHGGVERSGPTDRSNCHGWIFTAGQHFVSGEMVQRILDDNGYVLVTDPLPGDLIVYRDEDAHIQHTGLVRGKLDDGLLMIESKFGVGARFLHLPEDQPYTIYYEYYRTSRGGHLIPIRNGASRGIPRPLSDPRSGRSA